jgi:hypothetical protein
MGDHPATPRQLEDILVHVLEPKIMCTFGSRDLTQTTLGILKIMKSIQSHGRVPSEGLHRVFHDIFVGEQSKGKESILSVIAVAARPALRDFENRSLSNFIYAYGLFKYVLQFETGETFFDALALEVLPRLNTLEPRQLSNILWACANMGAFNRHLFG